MSSVFGYYKAIVVFVTITAMFAAGVLVGTSHFVAALFGMIFGAFVFTVLLWAESKDTEYVVNSTIKSKDGK